MSITTESAVPDDREDAKRRKARASESMYCSHDHLADSCEDCAVEQADAAARADKSRAKPALARARRSP